MVCLGFERALRDGRPVAIIEAAEGLGQSAATLPLLRVLAERGPACAYDRLGFGWSAHSGSARHGDGASAPVAEGYEEDRTPQVCAPLPPSPAAAAPRARPHPTPLACNRQGIARDLAYMLVNGSSTHGAPSLLLPGGVWAPIRPPFLLVGHGIGSVYTRQLAMDFPHLVAGLVSLDGPSLSGDPHLSDALKWMGQPLYLPAIAMFLQPIGLMRPFAGLLWSGLTPSVPPARLHGVSDSIGSPLAALVSRVGYTAHFQAVWRETHAVVPDGGSLSTNLESLARWSAPAHSFNALTRRVTAHRA
jgi:pimeloyl-ACP methyl ester carboxylesterase